MVARAATVEVVGDALARHRETIMIGARRPPMVAGSLLHTCWTWTWGEPEKDREFALRSGGTNTYGGVGAGKVEVALLQEVPRF